MMLSILTNDLERIANEDFVEQSRPAEVIVVSMNPGTIVELWRRSSVRNRGPASGSRHWSQPQRTCRRGWRTLPQPVAIDPL